MNSPRQDSEQSFDIRRTLVLVIALVMLAGWFFAPDASDGNSGKFAGEAMGRIGLVMGALWIAWPSIRRPAQWLPPGMAVGGVVLLGLLAARPTLIAVAIPAVGGLITVAALARMFKNKVD